MMVPPPAIDLYVNIRAKCMMVPALANNLYVKTFPSWLGWPRVVRDVDPGL